MFERMFKVKFLPCKNCFCYISSRSYLPQQGNYVKIMFGDGDTAYFSVNYTLTSLDKDCIGISSIYAKALGIKENDTVILVEVHKPPSIKSMSITPSCESDYEVLELLAENVQSTLLDQISVINSGKNIVIWIGRNIFVKVPVSDVKPVNLGCIDNLTEVIIKPPAKQNNAKSITYDKTKIQTKNNKLTSEVLNDDSIKYFMKLIEGLKLDEILLKHLDKYFDEKDDLLFRMIPTKQEKLFVDLQKYLHPFNVFVSRQKLEQNWLKTNSKQTLIICQLELLTNGMFPPKPLHVRLCILEDYIPEFNANVYEDNMYVGDVIMEHFSCKPGARGFLNYEPTTPSVNEIHICSKKNYLIDIKERFKQFLAVKTEGQPLLLNPEVVMDIDDGIKCLLKFTPIESKFCLVDEKLIRDCKYTLLQDLHVTEPDEEKMMPENNLNACNFGHIVDNVSRLFDCTRLNKFENVLLTGKPGTGKTTLTAVLQDKLKVSPYYLYSETIRCKQIKGKTLDSLLKLFSTTFSNLILHQPSVLILDDLHVLCENVPGEEVAPNAIYFNRISEMLHDLFKSNCENNLIGIIATCESTMKLNSYIYTSRGSHLFKNLFSIDSFKKEDRIMLLKFLFKNYTLKSVDFDELGVKTEGFVMQDLVNFANKAVYEAYKDDPNSSHEPTITNDHCERGLKNTTVLSLHDVQLHSPGDKDFSDVGGLKVVKDQLVETLLWPVQYPEIFAGAPLRLQTGMLLYGAPGTGKTLMAGAAARQCGLRLIAVKGPELLSKYIGASEQAVRDVFEKAQSARPCILFFDEFDSLAPRRGQDTTGVTDRVVNQLLTQLDGVESLTGVCVLAATSRPDLLDPALLRPGRLDKQLLCSLPSEAERLEILEALSKTLSLSKDVNFRKLASKTEGFSGADLQSVLYTAQLSSVDHLLLNTEPAPGSSKPVKITQKHLEDALKKTRPSLTQQDKVKYDRIYAQFQGGYKEDFIPGTKATLA